MRRQKRPYNDDLADSDKDDAIKNLNKANDPKRPGNAPEAKEKKNVGK